MTNRLADLAVLLAIAVLAVAAVTPLGGPADREPTAGGDRPDDHATPPVTRSSEPAPDKEMSRDHQPGSLTWEPSSDRPFPRLPRNVVAFEFTAELIDQCIAVADEIDPELARRLRELRAEDIEKLKQLLLRRGHRLLDLAELKERDPALYELKLLELNLDGQINRTAAELRAAHAEGDSIQIEVLEDNLRTYLRLQLASALRAREDYLCRLREHVEQLEESIEYDREHFDARIEMRFHQLLQGEPVETTAARQLR